MLTVDDCNTIIKKYEGNGFFYKISKEDVEKAPCTIDFIDITSGNIPGGPPGYILTINNTYVDGKCCWVNRETGEMEIVSGGDPTMVGGKVYLRQSLFETHDFCIYVTYRPSAEGHFSQMWYYPITDLTLVTFPDETFIPKKIYLHDIRGAGLSPMRIGSCNSYGADATWKDVTTFHDDNGDYINAEIVDFSKPYFCIQLGNKEVYIGKCVMMNKLPLVFIPTLYRGTPQKITLINSDTEEEITEFQAYYQGRKLKDNIITVPSGTGNVVDIVVDLKDPNYPSSTVKLKTNVTTYTCHNQSDVETAIENGIQTLQVGDNQNEVSLNSIELSNVTLINSNIQVSESILTDCQIIDSAYTDNGGNNITSTLFKDTDYNTTAQSNYNEVIFNECDIYDSEINLTGTITDCTITDSLIISDGVINIRDNTFTGVGSKEYFPSHLYLTGDYTVTGNTFTLEGEWEELSFNMCLIKATNNFNPSEFINKNTLNLNITYDDEPTNTFYYNLVDDDKIKAVRL